MKRQTLSVSSTPMIDYNESIQAPKWAYVNFWLTFGLFSAVITIYYIAFMRLGVYTPRIDQIYIVSATTSILFMWIVFSNLWLLLNNIHRKKPKNILLLIDKGVHFIFDILPIAVLFIGIYDIFENISLYRITLTLPEIKVFVIFSSFIAGIPALLIFLLKFFEVNRIYME